MDPEVRGFYVDDFGEDERLRLRAHGVLERVRTQELLARFLPPPPATVLDVGGGRSLRVIQSAADRSQQKVSVMFGFYRRHRRIRQAARSSFFGNQRNADHRRQRRVP